MIVTAYDYVTGAVSRVNVPDNVLCSIHFRRRLAVRPTVAIVNIRPRARVASPGLLSPANPGRVFLCDDCLDVTGEAEKDQHADLVRRRAL